MPNTLDAQIPGLLDRIAPDQPVLIAGPTASGKSALALAIASELGGVIVNADALQVFANWRVLTARPSAADEAMAPHALYGHVAGDAPYSVGHWLRDVTPFLAGKMRPIIVGGTGLNFAALTRGLVDIPPTPQSVRAAADAIRTQDFRKMLAELDAATLAVIDTLNPMRVQRAWEVQITTGRGLADWQADTPPPVLPVSKAAAFVMDADVDWLNARIARRFDVMLEQGALDEARENLHDWNPSHPASKAIGAPELIAYLRGEMDFDTAREKSIVASRQYAKRQRTWFRGHMDGYHKILLG